MWQTRVIVAIFSSQKKAINSRFVYYLEPSKHIGYQILQTEWEIKSKCLTSCQPLGGSKGIYGISVERDTNYVHCIPAGMIYPHRTWYLHIYVRHLCHRIPSLKSLIWLKCIMKMRIILSYTYFPCPPTLLTPGLYPLWAKT